MVDDTTTVAMAKATVGFGGIVGEDSGWGRER